MPVPTPHSSDGPTNTWPTRSVATAAILAAVLALTSLLSLTGTSTAAGTPAPKPAVPMDAAQMAAMSSPLPPAQAAVAAAQAKD
ncbi:hypothetical protein [Streptacidiphilus sp. PAMC 29251]